MKRLNLNFEAILRLHLKSNLILKLEKASNIPGEINICNLSLAMWSNKLRFKGREKTEG